VWKDTLDMERGKQLAFIYDSKQLCTTVLFMLLSLEMPGTRTLLCAAQLFLPITALHCVAKQNPRTGREIRQQQR
jgi:hypothetical protein